MLVNTKSTELVYYRSTDIYLSVVEEGALVISFLDKKKSEMDFALRFPTGEIN